MPWEYCDSTEMDARFSETVGKIRHLVKWKDAVIVDVNCGAAGVLRYLPECQQYIGNDIRAVWPERLPEWARVVPFDDAEMPILLGDLHIDVLMIFGLAYGTPHESQTVDKSFRTLMRNCDPDYVIVGKAKEWKHPEWSEVERWPEWKRYSICGFVDVPGEGLKHRHVRIHSRNDNHIGEE